jgi:hypothetical protein
MSKYIFCIKTLFPGQFRIFESTIVLKKTEAKIVSLIKEGFCDEEIYNELIRLNLLFLPRHGELISSEFFIAFIEKIRMLCE